MRIKDQAKRDIVIMFTATYCGNTYRKLAEMGRAPCPQLCEPVESVGVYVVDMDYEDGERTYESPVNMEHDEQPRITVKT